MCRRRLGRLRSGPSWLERKVLVSRYLPPGGPRFRSLLWHCELRILLQGERQERLLPRHRIVQLLTLQQNYAVRCSLLSLLPDCTDSREARLLAVVAGVSSYGQNPEYPPLLP